MLENCTSAGMPDVQNLVAMHVGSCCQHNISVTSTQKNSSTQRQPTCQPILISTENSRT
jgi:type III secretory pathway lipoprotein EscJ